VEEREKGGLGPSKVAAGPGRKRREKKRKRKKFDTGCISIIPA